MTIAGPRPALYPSGCSHATPHEEQAQGETPYKIKEEIEVITTTEKREILIHKRGERREPSTEPRG